MKFTTKSLEKTINLFCEKCHVIPGGDKDKITKRHKGEKASKSEQKSVKNNLFACLVFTDLNF